MTVAVWTEILPGVYYGAPAHAIPDAAPDCAPDKTASAGRLAPVIWRPRWVCRRQFAARRWCDARDLPY